MHPGLEALGGADRVGVLQGDLAGDGEGPLARVLVEIGGKAEGQRLGAGELAVGVDELAQHVVAHQAAPQGIAAHVGDKAPLHLHDRHAGGRMDDADVRAAGDLEAAPEAHAMDRSDDRHGELPPLHRHLLRTVCIAVGALGQRGFVLGRLPREIRQVEPGAEGPALAREHHGAQPFHPVERMARLDDPLKHLRVERVHLVGPHETDLGNAILPQFDGDAIIDERGGGGGHGRKIPQA